MPGNYQRDDETEAERLDRNYGELLQELRVAQTGVQVLFAFLLTIAFQQRFPKLGDYEIGLYVTTLLLAAVAAVLLIGPVAVHRLLFRQRLKDEIVDISSKLAGLGLTVLGMAIVSAVLFVLTVVLHRRAGLYIGGALLIFVVVLWLVVPLVTRQRHSD